MAKLCDGFTVGTVLSAINDVGQFFFYVKFSKIKSTPMDRFTFLRNGRLLQVMTTKRMVQLRVQPLTHIELINALSCKDPVYREEEDAFLSKLHK